MHQSEILNGLNEAQARAVGHVEGPLLTIAGPGSGKTRVVTHRIAYLIEQGISPFSIIALTFTNKAAQEMKARLNRLLDDAPVWMGTFHGYCSRFLRHYGRFVGLSENFSIFDSDDSKMAIEQAIIAAEVSLTHLKIGDIIRGISNLKNRVITPEMIEGRGHTALDNALSKVYPAYQKLLLQNNAVDFDDLLMHTASILRTNSDLRADLDSKHEYILVDEYQDTNLAQYQIVRALSVDHPNLNVTGDPDQSIYAWRGADIANILNFERDYPNVVTVRLEENYRSRPEILSVADSLISCNTRRKEKRLIATRESGSKVRLASYESARDEADHIADQIAVSVLDGTASAKDFAILYRTNAQSRLFEQALLRRKLNYQLIGGYRFYHRQEIRDLLAYLRLVYNPTDDISFQRIVNVPPRGLGEKTLQSVFELAKMKEIPMLVALRVAIDHGMLSKRALTGAKQFLTLYDRLVHQSTVSIVEMLQLVLSETKYIDYLSKRKSEAPDESIVGNIQELLSDAMEVEKHNEDGTGLQQFLEQVSLSSDTDSLSTDDRVTLMTLHSAKGLEFPSVFIIAIEQDILPHVRSKFDADQMEEERRLFFVGITRAKDSLQMSYAGRRGFDNTRMSAPSPFLLELPRAQMQMVDYTQTSAYDESFEDSPPDDEFDSHSFLHERSKPSKRKSHTERDRGSEWNQTVDKADYNDRLSNIDNRKIPRSDRMKSIDTKDELGAFAAKLVAINSKMPLGIKSAADISMSVTLTGVAVETFEQGMKVSHPRYGQGVICSVEGHGPKRMARIEFDNGEFKSFQLSKAPLDLL